MENQQVTTAILELIHRWEALKQAQPMIRIRNAADILGVTEVELLATRVGESVQRLQPDFRGILRKAQTLGKVMALTRNDDVVHERKGSYLNPTLDMEFMGLFVGEDIDLRIFFKSWASAYAVKDPFPGKEGKFRYSIQFFARDGQAIHKIYLTPHSHEEAYHQLVQEFLAEDQAQLQKVYPPNQPKEELADEEIDVESFRNEWINLKDTHDFFGVLSRYELTRTQALRLAPPGNYAVKVGNMALRRIVTLASEGQVPIMVFVGNQGMIQIHTGPVKKLVDSGDWFNILDPDFNLHVKEPMITDSWIVRKPTVDGGVTALECFNREGEQVVQLFGKRKPGIPELTAWREIVQQVEDQLALGI